MTRYFNHLLKVLSSSKLALVLVVLVILLSLAGAVLPQEGIFAPVDIARWQEVHPFVTKILRPIGLFRAFHSIPFLAIIFLLSVNTFTCTVLHLFSKGGIPALREPGGLRLAGFIVLHISLIMLFAGGFQSAATRMDGFIVLTEGQVFREEHGGYVRLVEGPLRKEHHKGFTLRLEKVRVEFRENRYLLGITSDIEIREKGDDVNVTKAMVRVNQPFSYRGITFTLGRTGFSPRLVIRERDSGRVLVNSFVALKTFQDKQEREYRDFLPLPFFNQRVILTLYPDHRRIEDRVEKTGEQPVKPILLVETEEESRQPVPRGYIPMGGSMAMGGYDIGFTGLRRWSSFKVVGDPGYPLVWTALWLAVVGLLLRYIPDLKRWFGQSKTTDKVNHEGHEDG